MAPEDIAPVLEVMVSKAMQDVAVTDNAAIVYIALVDAGKKFTTIELPAGRKWLAEQTGLTEGQVRRALERLEKVGYLHSITFEELTREHLKNWVKENRLKGNRDPKFIRLAQDPVLRGDIPDFCGEQATA